VGVSISRTFDEQFIYDCVTHPSNWGMVTDDGHSGYELFFPDLRDSNYWLRVESNGKILGLFLATQKSIACYEVHSALLPEARGMSAELAKSAICWMFENTPCKRIIAWIPKYNELAGKMAIDAGLKLCGINKESFMKNGILHDEYLFGVSKGK
jgi:RimJ/RimL family protein N-acetyltransferase